LADLPLTKPVKTLR